ncbi:MAG: Asp-tRNA(Asn)/Glu-tRNA(Gln) amidotransferase subunit GatA [Patescibacteria group bacterium]
MSLTQYNLSELSQKIKSQAVTAREVVSDYLKKSTADFTSKKSLGVYLTLASEQALSRADEIDEKIASGEEAGELAGVPIAVKDIIVTRGITTTAGSKILKNYVPPYSATVVEKLENAGAIVIGKTNCDEFAMGASGENSGFFPTHNPWDVLRVPGGSSSGSAAAVAAGFAPIALGTDTGGSIRQPAAFCGVVGLKPTYGRVSRFGIMAMTSSLDQVGPFTHTVADAALLLKIIAGFDEKDATSVKSVVPDYPSLLNKDIKKIKIGVPKEFFGEGLSADVKKVVEEAIDKLAELGAEIIPVSLPSMPYALAAYYILCPAEVSTNLARFDGLKYGESLREADLLSTLAKTRGELFGREVKRRIMLGTFVLSAGYYDAYYKSALAARQAIKNDFNRVFKEVDILATPTTPTTAFELGSKNQDPLAMYLADVYTVPVNIAGLPAISVPCGLSDGLPVGLQLIGNMWQEEKILKVAYNYEQATEWIKLTPEIKS